jgi:hypothetical protein
MGVGVLVVLDIFNAIEHAIADLDISRATAVPSPTLQGALRD